jgi:hypothetical protein
MASSEKTLEDLSTGKRPERRAYAVLHPRAAVGFGKM